jgi:hypothetical protein
MAIWEALKKDIDKDPDVDDDLFEYEAKYPHEYYLATMANFNERRHGQKRYIFLPTLL